MSQSPVSNSNSNSSQLPSHLSAIQLNQDQQAKVKSNKLLVKVYQMFNDQDKSVPPKVDNEEEGQQRQRSRSRQKQLRRRKKENRDRLDQELIKDAQLDEEDVIVFMSAKQEAPQIFDVHSQESQQHHSVGSSQQQKPELGQLSKKQNEEKDPLSEKNKFFKTRLCQSFIKGVCRKPKQECCYAHGQADLRKPTFKSKNLCFSFMKGHCHKSAEECRFVHDVEKRQQLRRKEKEKEDKMYKEKVAKPRDINKMKNIEPAVYPLYQTIKQFNKEAQTLTASDCQQIHQAEPAANMVAQQLPASVAVEDCEVVSSKGDVVSSKGDVVSQKGEVRQKGDASECQRERQYRNSLENRIAKAFFEEQARKKTEERDSFYRFCEMFEKWMDLYKDMMKYQLQIQEKYKGKRVPVFVPTFVDPATLDRSSLQQGPLFAFPSFSKQPDHQDIEKRSAQQDKLIPEENQQGPKWMTKQQVYYQGWKSEKSNSEDHNKECHSESKSY